MYKKFRDKFRESNNLQIFILICGAILFYLLMNNLGIVRNALGYIFGILAPVISAAIIAFLIHPIVAFFEKKVLGRLKRRKYLHSSCVIFTVLLLVVLVILLVYLVINQLAVSVTHLIDNFDSYLKSLINLINNAFGGTTKEINIFGVNILELETTGIQEFGATVVNWCTEHIEGIIGGVSSVGSNLMNIVICIMLVIYMLLDSDHLKMAASRYFRSYMQPEKYIEFADKCSRYSRVFIRYFACNILDSLIIGVACYIFMVIVGLPYSLLVSVVVGVCNFVPTFGPIIGAVIGGFLILLINPLGTLWFIIYTLISQFCDGNLLKPKLFGDTTGLRPMWVLAAIIICGGLFGVTGMILGVPLFAIISDITNERVEKRIQRWDY